MSAPKRGLVARVLRCVTPVLCAALAALCVYLLAVEPLPSAHGAERSTPARPDRAGIPTRSPAMRLALVFALMLLTACASTPDANYTAYLQAQAAADQRDKVARGSVADAAASCNNDATCVVAVAGFAAMAMQSGSGRPSVQPYVRQPGAFEKFGLAAIGALAPLAQAYAAIDAGRNSVDIARIGADREVAVTQAWSQTTTGVAEAFAGLAPSTAITVGGDYVTGTQHIGDSIGRDAIDGDQHVGDAVGRDSIGGDQHLGDAIGGDDNSGNSGRIDSPGPYESGDRCTGEQCQAPPAPEPAPDEEG